MDIQVGESYAFIEDGKAIWATVLEVWDNPDRDGAEAQVELDLDLARERVGNYPIKHTRTVRATELETLDNHPLLT